MFTHVCLRCGALLRRRNQRFADAFGLANCEEGYQRYGLHAHVPLDRTVAKRITDALEPGEELIIWRKGFRQGGGKHGLE